MLKDRIAPAAEEEEPETILADQDGEQQESDDKTPKRCPRCRSKNLLFIEHYWPEEAGSDGDQWESPPIHGTRQPTLNFLQTVPP